MSDRLIRSESLARIADSIRIKIEDAGSMSPGEMAKLILQTGSAGVPACHITEAGAVADRIRRLRDTGARVMVFGVMGDSHVQARGDNQILTGCSARHAAFAMESTGLWTGCSFLANLGDNCWNGDPDGADGAAAESFLNGCITAGFSRLPGYRLTGEYDWSSDPEQIYRISGIHNVFDAGALTAHRCFGYTDYPAEKVRLIVLNTSDCCGAAAGFGMSYEQKAFLMYALDLSAKADHQQWQILLLSHYPLDWPGDSCYNTAADVKAILTAYVSGGTAKIAVSSAYAAAEKETPADYSIYSGGYLIYDYSGINSPRIIANIHGHVHNASFGRMAGHLITRVATPNTCFYLENGSVGDLYTVDSPQPKTAYSARDTAVTFYAVDLDGGVIHSFAYGAGEDRVIPYL